jgi:fluoride ion exporter CrcB/FEX
MVSMIGIGFSGSLTTMSAFAFESINLINNSYGLFIINILFTLLFVLLGAYLGRTSAQYLYLRSDT